MSKVTQNPFRSAQSISLVTKQFNISLVSNGAKCMPYYTVSCTHKHKVAERYVTPIFPEFMQEHIDPAEINMRYRTPHLSTSGLQQSYTKFHLLEMTHCQILPNRIS
jgi:hypothetical protein